MNVTFDDFIKHKNFKDVAIKVKVVKQYADYVSVYGTWWNQAFETSFEIMFMKNPIKIKHADLYDWLVCKNQNPKCLRYETWEPI